MPKKVDHTERRKTFAEAAIAVIAEKGLENLRLIDVARKAGTTTGSLTHYFDDKDQVIAAALDYVVEAALKAERDPNNTLVMRLATFLPLDEEGRAASRVWLAFFSQSLGRPTLSDMHCQYYEEFVERLVGHLSKDPALRNCSAEAREMKANLLITLVDGLLVRATLDPRNWPAKRQLEHLEAGVAALGVTNHKMEEFSR